MTTAQTPQASSSESPAAETRATVKLPYSISNVVFIEKLPLWIVLVGSLLAAAISVIVSLTVSEDGFPTTMVLGFLASAAVAGLLLHLGSRFLWTPALMGRRTAVITVFVLYIPAILLGAWFVLQAVFALFASAVVWWSNVPALSVWITVAVILAVLGLLLLVNAFEQTTWAFARLNNCCPNCGKWRFGLIRHPGTVRCGDCGTVIEFVREP